MQKGVARVLNCKEALPLIHEFLDGDLAASAALDLEQHLISCPGCKKVFNQLEQTEAMVRMLPRTAVSTGLTSRIMASLPEQTKGRKWFRWVKRHPAVSIVSILFVIMLGSMF